MILLSITLTSLLLVSYTSAIGLDPTDFENTIESMCFDVSEEYRFFGQKQPLAHTLENFIGLLEKLEAENPRLKIEDELYFFIQNYIYENVYFTEFGSTGKVTTWKPESAEMQEIKKLWEPLIGDKSKKPWVSIPYSQGENCSIFNMLSHSIIMEARPVQSSPTNNSRLHLTHLTESSNVLYPMEIGVVSVRGTREAVALGKVLIGMYIGTKSQRIKSITDLRTNIPEDKQGMLNNKMIDPLFAFTVSEAISLTKWPGKRTAFGKDGDWRGISIEQNFDTKDICPVVYKLADHTNSTQSYSSLRGAADGLILGSFMQSIIETKAEVKLSEVLRMYYSRGGVSGEIDAEARGPLFPDQKWASFCNRESLMNFFTQHIKDQVALYVTLIISGYNQMPDITKNALAYYETEKNEAFRLGNMATYCSADISTSKVENLPLESPLDIIAVLDTVHGIEQFKKQQLILGYFVKEMELSYYGSRITILTDQKLSSPTSASTGIVTLKSIVEEAYSSACAACMVVETDLGEMKSDLSESEVIMAMDQLLQAKKENETSYNGVKGKVIIYFNFKEEEVTSIKNSEEAKVEAALKNLNLNHRDVAKYAVGRSKELVKKYSRNDISFALDVDTPQQTAKDLFAKVSKDAATLQYIDCEKATSENAAVYEDFVSRNAIQHWRMPAKYFYKSKNYKFTFESTFGSIKVCHFQGTSTSPENQGDHCKEGKKVEFGNSNPCKGLNEYSCSPFNFAIIGMNSTEDTSPSDVCRDTMMTATKCKTMDQIKFKVSHEGIRCSGTVGLLTSPMWIILGVLLLQILQRRQ